MIGQTSTRRDGFELKDYLLEATGCCSICGELDSSSFVFCDKCAISLRIENMYGTLPIDFAHIKEVKDIPASFILTLSLNDVALLFEVDPKPYEELWVETCKWYGYSPLKDNELLRIQLDKLRKKRLPGNTLFKVVYEEELAPLSTPSSLESLLFGEG